MRNIQQLFVFVKAHGHITTLARDSKGSFVGLWIPWSDEQGRQGHDYYRIENMQQAREALGY